MSQAKESTVNQHPIEPPSASLVPSVGNSLQKNHRRPGRMFWGWCISKAMHIFRRAQAPTPPPQNITIRRRDVPQLLSDPAYQPKIVVLLVFILIVLFAAYKLATNSGNLVNAIRSLPDDLNFLAGVFLAVALNLIASIWFFVHIRHVEQDRISQIKELGPNGLIEHVLADIDHFRGLFRHDQITSVTFDRDESRPDVLLCHITYSYWRTSPNSGFAAVVYRIRQPAGSSKLPLISDLARTHDFVWFNIETDFPNPITADKYTIDNIFIDEVEVPVTTESSRDGDVIRFFGSDSVRRSNHTECQVNYRVTLPVERESCICLNVEVPTFNSRFRADFSKLPGVQFIIFERCGIRHNPVTIPDGDRTETQQFRGWLLPKDGIVISWWDDSCGNKS